MRKYIIITVASVGIISTCAVITRMFILARDFDRTEVFFQEKTGFQLRLDSALNGDSAARLKYYSIPDEYHLDGAYSESYEEGLDKLCSKIGIMKVKGEITGNKNAWYITQVGPRADK